MRINYFSDIHLEFGETNAPDVKADIIIAAGDIGIYNEGVEWLKSFNRPVIYIAGNHEYYDSELITQTHEFHQQCENSQVHFLENSQFIYKGVRFLGCTLWADLFAEGDEKANKLANTLNDFKQISYHEGFMNTMQYSQQFHRSKKWLERELAKPFDGKTVVISHHAPTQWSWNKSPNSVTRLAYCSDLKPLIHRYPIDVWIHGHVHSIADYRIGDTRILCNPRGYMGRRLVDNFDINKMFVI